MPESTATTIKLSTPGYVALIDLTDLEVVSRFKWHADKTKWGPYARAYVPGSDNKKVSLHRLILDAPKGVQVDHINGDGLDCRRSNLRLATQQQNNGNRAKTTNPTSSRFKGVDRHHGAWRARIRSNGRQWTLGHFDREGDAARAYDAAAEEFFGEFARFNFPNDLAQSAAPPPPAGDRSESESNSLKGER